MPSSTLLSRSMKLVRLLNSQGECSTMQLHKEICNDEEYKTVSLRQIQRDLSALEQEQIVESEKNGREHFWSLRREYKNILPIFSIAIYILFSYLIKG